MAQEWYIGQGFCLGFMAGVAAIFLAPHLLLDLGILSTARNKAKGNNCSFIGHLDKG